MDDHPPLSALIPGLTELHRLTRGAPTLTVALLDGPVDVSHPCFHGAHLEVASHLIAEAPGDDPATRHGTHIASLLFGQSGSPIQGIAPGCRGLIIPIYSPSAAGGITCSQLDLARAIHTALERGAHVINISGGEFSADGTSDPLLEQALEACDAAGVLVVAAAGNHGCACLQVPAARPQGLAVGALDAHGAPMAFSNWGDAYRSHGLMALGEDLPGAVPGGGVALKSGTSFATPVVAGTAALLLSLLLQREGKVDASRVRQAMLDSALPCDATTHGDCARRLKGVLHLPGALALLRASVTPSSLPDSPVTLTSRDQAASGPRSTLSPTPPSARPAMTHTFSTPETSEPTLGPDPTLQAGIQAAGFAPSRTEVTASECQTCAGGSPQVRTSHGPSSSGLVYALGQIGFDFGTEARRDAFLQLSGTNVLAPEALLAYLEKDPSSAAHLTWTLMLDATVVYAIEPQGPFASATYDRLREFLNSQSQEGVEIVSIPGVLRGTTTLASGQRVPLLVPDARGMFSWTKETLVRSVMGLASANGKETEAYLQTMDGIQNFLERIYYEIRNLGLSPQERAINFAATNAFQLEFVYQDAIKAELKLDSIEVERSPICRPGSECWDVKLVFFNPARRMEQARRVYRFTVDVSDVIPVTVGKVRHWDIY